MDKSTEKLSRLVKARNKFILTGRSDIDHNRNSIESYLVNYQIPVLRVYKRHQAINEVTRETLTIDTPSEIEKTIQHIK